MSLCAGLLDHVTVLIGVAHKGRAMGGVINQPYYNYKAGPNAPLGRCIWGIVGLGTYNTGTHPPTHTEELQTHTHTHTHTQKYTHTDTHSHQHTHAYTGTADPPQYTFIYVSFS
jgi:hypothetical protein